MLPTIPAEAQGKTDRSVRSQSVPVCGLPFLSGSISAIPISAGPQVSVVFSGFVRPFFLNYRIFLYGYQAFNSAHWGMQGISFLKFSVAHSEHLTGPHVRGAPLRDFSEALLDAAQ